MADRPSMGSALYSLMATIEDRRQKMPPKSYTTQLFSGGPELIGAKILEEAREVVEAGQSAATADERSHLIYEACDLLYHLLVLLGYHDITLAEIESELQRRFGLSGLDEKAARQGKSDPGS